MEHEEPVNNAGVVQVNCGFLLTDHDCKLNLIIIFHCLHHGLDRKYEIISS